MRRGRVCYILKRYYRSRKYVFYYEHWDVNTRVHSRLGVRLVGVRLVLAAAHVVEDLLPVGDDLHRPGPALKRSQPDCSERRAHGLGLPRLTRRTSWGLNEEE